MYSLFKKIMFRWDAEKAHHLTFGLLAFVFHVPGIKFFAKKLYKSPKKNAFTWRGISFSNPVGLAAGLDKNAALADELSAFGFGFIEVGTITPRPQEGNAKPRLFRLPEDKALINRMGFNNEGVEKVKQNLIRLRAKNPSLVLGINVGKNKSTPNESAVDDYVFCIEQLQPYAHYFAVNVSSPNTPGLRSLQAKEPLGKLLLRVKEAAKHTPVLLKISPDVSREELDDIVEVVREANIDGIIATNTTLSREGLHADKTTLDKIGDGGLSGAILLQRSNDVIAYIRQKMGQDFFIIGVGGIVSEEAALSKLQAGANAIQLYTGFIYEGPSLVKKINVRIAESKKLIK